MYKSADTTSERQSSQWFVIPFCPQRGKNDFQCYIFEVLGLENLKGALWKGEGYAKGNCCCCCFISEVSETGEVLKYLLLFYKDEVQLKYQLSISTNTLLRKIRVVFSFQHPYIVHVNTSPAKCLFKGVMCLTAWLHPFRETLILLIVHTDHSKQWKCEPEPPLKAALYELGYSYI